VLLNIRYGGAMAESDGSFRAGRHHMAMAKRLSRGGRFPDHVMVQWIEIDGKGSGGAASAEVRKAWMHGGRGAQRLTEG